MEIIPKVINVPSLFVFKDNKINSLSSGVLTPLDFIVNENKISGEVITLEFGDDYVSEKMIEGDEYINSIDQCFKIGSVIYFKFNYSFIDFYYSQNIDGTALTKLEVGTFPAKPAVATTPDAIDGTYFYTETKDVSGVTHYRLRNKVHPEWVTSWETIYPQIIEDGVFLYVVFKDTVAGVKSGTYVIKHDEQNYFSMLAEKISDEFQIWE